MALPVLIGLDVGTSAVRATAFDTRGAVLAQGQHQLDTRYEPGARVEQDASAWADGALRALTQVASGLGAAASGVIAVGLTGQCPSFALIDGAGRPTTAGILYADNRAAGQAERLAGILGRAAVRARTGQWPSPFYIAPKLMWLAARRHEQHPGPGRNPAERHTLVQPRDLAGLSLVGRLATDGTHAACTLLYDLHERAWLDSWVEQLGLGHVALPPVLRPGEVLGTLLPQVAHLTGLPPAIPVIVGGADSLSAALGRGVIAEGLLSDASGSSTCLDAAVTTFVEGEAVSIYPHVVPGMWCADAGMNATGSVLRWAAQMLCDGDLAQLERLAAGAPPGCAGVLFSPYLADGERTGSGAMGAWSHLLLRHGRQHLARAVYEGLTFGLLSALDGLRAAGITLTEIRTSGGGGNSHVWNQLKADVFGLPLTTAAQPEAAALGAAMLAGLASGLYHTVTEAVDHCVRDRERCAPRQHLRSLYQDTYRAWRQQNRAYHQQKEGSRGSSGPATIDGEDRTGHKRTGL